MALGESENVGLGARFAVLDRVFHAQLGAGVVARFSVSGDWCTVDFDRGSRFVVFSEELTPEPGPHRAGVSDREAARA